MLRISCDEINKLKVEKRIDKNLIEGYLKIFGVQHPTPFLANFFLNNKLPEALNASDSVEELVWEVLAILPSGKTVVAEDIAEEFEC